MRQELRIPRSRMCTRVTDLAPLSLIQGPLPTVFFIIGINRAITHLDIAGKHLSNLSQIESDKMLTASEPSSHILWSSAELHPCVLILMLTDIGYFFS